MIVHDVEYMKYIDDDKSLQLSDEKLRTVAKKQGGLASWAVDKTFYLKRAAENFKLWKPSTFTKKLVRDSTVDKQKRTGKFLERRFILKEK